ncbi:MAG: F0F1 ATP synthase subunit delta, partial [Desulfatiglandales bacterium]
MIGAAKVARRYAKALLDIGKEEGKYLDYGKELGAFLDLCEKTPELLGVLSSKIIPSDERRRILDFVLEKGGFSEVIKRFFQVLLEKERIGFLREIKSYYTKLCDELQGIVR